MNRVSTAGNYATVLANLTASQARQIEAGGQVSSQKKATDLKGYARNAETLTAMRSLQTRVDGFLGQTQLLKDKLTVQDTALNQVTDAVQKARQAMADALASGRGDTLMQELGAAFSDVTEGLNTKHNGQYLFSGGQVNTLPTTASGLASLTVFLKNMDYWEEMNRVYRDYFRCNPTRATIGAASLNRNYQIEIANLIAYRLAS